MKIERINPGNLVANSPKRLGGGMIYGEPYIVFSQEWNEGKDSEGLPYKYCNVYVNISSSYFIINKLLAEKTSYKITKNKKHYGALYTSGWGFSFTDYLKDAITKNMDLILRESQNIELDLGSKKVLI